MNRYCWIAFAAAVCVILAHGVLAAEGTQFQFSLDKAALTSAGVYTPDGLMVRTLWTLKELPAGKHTETWDGLDDLGRNLPPGSYEVRVAIGSPAYASMGVIGNNGIGSSMQSATEDVRVDPASGDIFTANTWEEAGQDFKRVDANGKYVMDAKFRARNGVGGAPSGMPESVAIDGDSLYFGIYTLNDEYEKKAGKTPGGQIIRKFNKDTGEPVKFTEAPGGYIRVHYPDPDWAIQWGHDTLRSLAVLGNTLLSVDEKFDRVVKYDKTTGMPLGEFPVKAPRSIAIDAQKRLWIAHDSDKVTVFDLDGKKLGEVKHPAKQIECMRLDRQDRLWLADLDARQIQVYKMESLEKATLEKTYGQKPQAGKLAPLDIYTRIRFDVMPDGGFVITQSPGHGCIMSRFGPDGTLIWQQVGLEFCTNGTYDQKQPDLFISSLLNAYRLTDLAKGDWRFEGNIGASEQLPGFQSSGNPRIIELGGRKFYYCMNGERVLVLRSDNGMLVPVTMLGFNSRSWKEDVLGELTSKERAALWFTWHDSNADGTMQVDEVVKQTPTTRLGGFSTDVDEQGNLLFSNHNTRSVYEMPLVKLDERG
ncbi:MAG TPA: FlgD immunoglobulin-like domain containing protein, partial [Planctomycetota bacterium]|nr:FlgD immunoglobulin-like domain containing protein [Planctomycetota bacterium]